MPESNLSKVLMKRLKSVGHATRIENLATVGMPDVSYCIDGREGFIENKWISAWPRDASRIVLLRHYTAQQRIWHCDRTSAGGNVWVMLGVGSPLRDVLIFDGGWAASFLGRVSRPELIRGSTLASIGMGFPWEHIRALLVTRTAL